MKYTWKSADLWEYNHLVSGYTIYCMINPINQKLLSVLHKEDEKKSRCINCIQFNLKEVRKTTCPNVLHINRKIFI